MLEKELQIVYLNKHASHVEFVSSTLGMHQWRGFRKAKHGRRTFLMHEKCVNRQFWYTFASKTCLSSRVVWSPMVIYAYTRGLNLTEHVKPFQVCPSC